jgi:uncharacterized protein
MNQSIIMRILRYPLVLMFGALVFALGPMIAGQLLANAVMPEAVGLTLIAKASISAGFCVIGYVIFEKLIERRAHSDFALNGKMGNAAGEWLAGIGFGTGLFASVVGITYILGGYRITGWNGASVLLAGVAMAIASGVVEEILLRGIIFRYVEAAAGSVISLIFSAALFGALHLGNPNASFVAAFAIAIEAGVMLAAIYMLTRRLWAAIGVHMAWNFTQGPIFGVPVSGFKDPGLAQSVLDGPEWMTGGAFGLEASVTAMLMATTAGCLLLYWAYRRGAFIAAPWRRKPSLDAQTSIFT